MQRQVRPIQLRMGLRGRFYTAGSTVLPSWHEFLAVAVTTGCLFESANQWYRSENFPGCAAGFCCTVRESPIYSIDPELLLSSMPSERINLSLVIPTYNRADLIAETIESALRQRVPFFEIIVVNDGSTDDTEQVLGRFGDKLRLITLSNGGVQNARNVGIAAARGDYIALCDSDDLLEPEFVAVTGQWLADQPAFDALYCNFVTFDESGTHPDKFSLAPPGFFEKAQRSGDFWHAIPDLYARTVGFQPLFPSGCVVRKSFCFGIGGFDTRFYRVGGEDWEFTLRVLAKGHVALCARPLVRIRKHSGNESADSMRQMRGTADILEFALSHHAEARAYQDIILRSIDERRADVFDAAFARGAFDTAAAMLSQLRRTPRNPKFLMKTMITKLPRILRARLWGFTQMG